MSDSAQSDHGRFVWDDLMTTDRDAAAAFYSELLGWNIKAMPVEGMGEYHMIHRPVADGDDEGLGGIVQLEKEHGLPSHWISYVAVDDVDATCERAAAAGGKTCVPPTDLPNIGRFAVIEDGGGAYISPFKTAHGYLPEADGPPPDSSVCWHELMTNDVAKARTFYSEVFGWKPTDIDMGPAGTYTILKRGDKDAGGIMQMPEAAAGTPPHWLAYIAVPNVDEATAKSTALGGKTFCPPTDIPNIGRFSVNADPTGAVFAFFKGASTKC